MIVDQDGNPASSESVVPPLNRRQEEEAEDRTSVHVLVVHEAIRKDGEEELQRPASALAWSGLAAGLSMGFSFLTEALFAAHLPDTSWAPLLINLGYPVGFLIVIIGRQQLFTENTLTAIIPLLARRNLATLLAVGKLWTIVLLSNLCGATIFAWVVEAQPVLKPEFSSSLLAIATAAGNVAPAEAFLRAIFSGWLIAMVVWMNAATDSGRLSIIVIFTYLVGLAGLTHIVAGSVEIMFLVVHGSQTLLEAILRYMLPTLAGNIVGGVALVSALNHAQVIAGSKKAGTNGLGNNLGSDKDKAVRV